MSARSIAKGQAFLLEIASIEMQIVELDEEICALRRRSSDLWAEHSLEREYARIKGVSPEELAPEALGVGSEEKDFGWIYFIQGGDGSPIKIGRAADARRRLRGLQTAHHEELRILTMVRGGPKLEKWLHAAFENDRLRGEWFSASTRLVQFVDALEKARAA